MATAFKPVCAATGQEVSLAMQRLWLTGRLLSVGARLMVRHLFQSAETKPLEVVYSFALPRDAALRRFRISGEGFSVRSELKPVDEAVRVYEAGVEAGHLASLARLYGDGVVNLTVGNIRPGETVSVSLELLAGVEMRDDGFRFRFPFALAPAYHARARTVEVSPGTGEIELPEDEFGDVILPRFQADAATLHAVGFDLDIGLTSEAVEIASPSHPVRVALQPGRRARVGLAGERDVPDRDLVLDVRTAEHFSGALAGLDRHGKGRFAVVVPSVRFGAATAAPRRVVILLDRSGSMQGAPIEQARRAIAACLGALSGDDLFGLVAFDDKVDAFRKQLVRGTMEEREAAGKFLARVDARGGTELASAIAAAAKLLGSEGGDILVITDGEVFATEQILADARAAGARIHCLGIGSAGQDRFLALLARETGGVSRYLTARERVDLPAVDLFASVGRPVATGIVVKTDALAGAAVAPDPPPSVFADSPLVLFGEASGAAEGELRVEWTSGHLEVPVKIGVSPLGETLRLLQGARLITDLESRVISHQRESQRIEKRLEALSEAFGLASRRMALVAVVERAGDRAGDVPKTVVVPVGMPQDKQFSAYFGAPAGSIAMADAGASYVADITLACAQPSPTLARAGRPRFSLSKALFGRRDAVPAPSAPPPADRDDLLLQLAARIQSDGGMPGADTEERLLATLLALRCFVAEGHTAKRGAFRTHVERMARFLERFGRPDVKRALERILAGQPAVDWRVEAADLIAGKSLDAAAVWAKI